MNSKTIIYIFVAIAIVGIAFYFKNKKDNALVEEKGIQDPAYTVPTLADIMRKGYDETEANQILSALEAGKDINY